MRERRSPSDIASVPIASRRIRRISGPVVSSPKSAPTGTSSTRISAPAVSTQMTLLVVCELLAELGVTAAAE